MSDTDMDTARTGPGPALVDGLVDTVSYTAIWTGLVLGGAGILISVLRLLALRRGSRGSWLTGTVTSWLPVALAFGMVTALVAAISVGASREDSNVRQVESVVDAEVGLVDTDWSELYLNPGKSQDARVAGVDGEMLTCSATLHKGDGWPETATVEFERCAATATVEEVGP